MIGIDRMVLYNLGISRVDTDILELNGFTMIKGESSNSRVFENVTGESITIDYIKVSKEQQSELVINELRIGRKEITGNRNVDYENLEVNLSKSISSTKTNEKNISNLEELKKSLEIVERELEELGFGKIDLSKADIKEIEININIELSRQFKEYEPVLEYLRELLPKQIKTAIGGSFESCGVYSGFKVGNRSIDLKFYDKRENVNRKYSLDIGKELLRMEYSYNSPQKIENTFGTKNLAAITKDNFKTISAAFKSELQGHLIDRIYKDIDKQQKHATRQIKSYKGVFGIGAVDNYLKNYQYDLFDIEIILAALRDTERSNHYSRQAKKTINSALEIEGKELFGNINKLNEILGKLEFEKIELDITRGIKKEVGKYY